MRSQTPESPSWFGRKTLLIAAGGIGVAAAVLALTLRSTSPLPDTSAEIATPSFGEAPLSDAPMVAEMTSDTPASGHPVYRHSVVAGGVHDVDEVRRAVADPVVREHYASVSMDKLKVVATPARRDAHMSYRIGDRIYWTKKKIALSAGEAVLTDGETTIRARCGNLVSDEAMLPTSDEEPPASAFDAVEPRGNGAPVAGNANTALADGLLARSGGGAASVYPGLSAGAFGQQGNDRNDQQGVGGFSSGNLGGSAGSVGGGAGSRRPSPGGSSDGALTSNDTSDGGSPGEGGGPGEGKPGDGNPGGGPPGFVNPGGGNPGDDDTPGFENPPGFTPSDFNPPGFGEEPTPGGPGNPGGPELPPGFGPETPPVTIGQTPPETVPVPEPASLVLFGSGLALTAWRARRQHTRRKKAQE